MPTKATKANAIDQRGMSLSSSLTEKDELESLRAIVDACLTGAESNARRTEFRTTLVNLYNGTYESDEPLSIGNISRLRRLLERATSADH